MALKEILTDYVYEKLQDVGIPRQNVISVSNLTVLKKVIKLCTELEKRFKNEFSPTLELLQADMNNRNLNRATFFSVLDNIIADGINWGRIIALLTFAGMTSVMTVECGQLKNVDLLIDWTSTFMDQKVQDWIKENGGMEGFTQYFSNQKPQKTARSGWGTLLAGALGIVAVGAIVVRS